MRPAVRVLGAWEGLAGEGLVGPVAEKGRELEVMTSSGRDWTDTHFTDEGT